MPHCRHIAVWIVLVQAAYTLSETSFARGHAEYSATRTKWIPNSGVPQGYYRRRGSSYNTNSRPEKTDAPLEENPVEPPLRIGSFNVQTLGKRKFSNATIMSSVEKVVLRYDLIAILEVMVFEQFYITDFLKNINRLAPNGVVYNVSISNPPEHPNATTYEQVVFLYRTDKLKVLQSQMFPNVDLNFYRSPYIVVFSSPTLRDLQRFVAVGLHVKPSQAVQEINALADVYDYVHGKYNIEDVLMMGDFNADCSYVGEMSWKNIALWTREEFIWPIPHSMDTTTNHKSCALDRFVFAGSKMEDGVIMASAMVFNFQEAYGLSNPETKSVSDHWPIEIQIRGKMSDAAEKHLSSEVCVNVKDSRRVAVSAAATISGAKGIGYVGKQYTNGFSLRNVTFTVEDALASLKVLNSAFPNLVTHEQCEGIAYKIRYETLADPSSFADVRSPKFVITVRVDGAQCTVFACRRTTVN